MHAWACVFQVKSPKRTVHSIWEKKTSFKKNILINYPNFLAPKTSGMEENDSYSWPQLVWDLGLVELSPNFLATLMAMYSFFKHLVHLFAPKSKSRTTNSIILDHHPPQVQIDCMSMKSVKKLSQESQHLSFYTCPIFVDRHIYRCVFLPLWDVAGSKH